MYSEFKSFILFSIVIAIMLSSPANCKNDTLEGKGEDVKDSVENYLLALEKCDRSKGSLETLTSAMKRLIAAMDLRRQQEQLAVLFAFPNLRRDVFPGLEFLNPYQLAKKPRILHVLIHRSDGTLFSFNQHGHDDPYPSLAYAVDIFHKMKERKGKESIMKKKGYTREITHTVVGGLKFASSLKGQITLSASYLCDSFDMSNAVLNMTV